MPSECLDSSFIRSKVWTPVGSRTTDRPGSGRWQAHEPPIGRRSQRSSPPTADGRDCALGDPDSGWWRIDSPRRHRSATGWPGAIPRLQRSATSRPIGNSCRPRSASRRLDADPRRDRSATRWPRRHGSDQAARRGQRLSEARVFGEQVWPLHEVTRRGQIPLLGLLAPQPDAPLLKVHSGTPH